MRHTRGVLFEMDAGDADAPRRLPLDLDVDPAVL
jgi:hypothetical protein